MRKIFPRAAEKQRHLIFMAVLVLSAGVLSACSNGANQSSSTRHAYQKGIDVNKSTMRLKLRLAPGKRKLSRKQSADVENFVAHFKSSGSGIISVSRPLGSKNEITAASAALQIKRIIANAGISSSSSATTGYYAGRSRRTAPIIMSFTRHFARARGCGQWPSNLAYTYSNQSYENFGCAHFNNLAAMVANPRDLRRPRRETPASAARRDTVLGKYVKGEPTASQTTSNDSGKVSNIGK